MVEKKYDPEFLKKLQKLELSILKDIIKICDKHNISFCAYSGTAIGAVRHSGFIPWDDDIDLVFLREDYDRFVKALKTDLPDKYEFLSQDNCDDYFMFFSKVVLKDTHFKEWWSDQVSFKQGIFVDIFILDNLTDSKLKQFYYKKMGRWLRKFLSLSMLKFNNYPKYKQFVAVNAHKFLRFFNLNPSFFKNRIRKLLSRYSDVETENLYDITGRDFTYVYRRSFFDELIKFPFEDVELYLPKDYVEYLSVEYETPLELPPEEDRYNHIDAEIDFGIYK